MRALLTGATGFVGRHVLDALIETGFDVVAAHRGEPGAAHARVQWVRADLTERESARALVDAAQATHLVHLGWRAVSGDVANARDNIDWLGHSLALTRDFVDAGGRRIIGCGSCFEYDWSGGICHEDKTPLAPATFYGAAKHALHVALAGLAKQARIECVWARIFFVYGPHEHPNRLVAAVINALSEGRPAETTHGRQIRDYVHVDDVARGIAALARADVQGAFNIASGATMTLKDIVYAIADELRCPDLVRIGAKQAPAYEPSIIVGDPSKARNLLGFEARIDLRDGIARTIEAMRRAA
jgi:nucleoside-diphosphate-sugar epimerase